MSDYSILPWQNEQWRRFTNQVRHNRNAHAYLLAGEQGLGKAHFANNAARYLLCSAPQADSACGQCGNCRYFEGGANPDLLTVGPQENSRVIKVEQVRALTDFANKTVHGSGRKVIILEQAHNLNISAANALLKTLEEPPAGTVLLLLSDTPGRLLATIRSRCQRIPFQIPETSLARAWLQQAAATSEGVGELLTMARGKPLLARALLEDGSIDERNNIVTALGAVLAGRVDPLDFAAKSRELGATTILEQLWHITGVALKAVLSPASTGELDTGMQGIMNSLAGSQRSPDELLGRLINMNQAAEEARQQVSGVSNPNPQLVLEGVMWRWSRLTG